MKAHFNRKHFKCKICGKPHYALGLCWKHYRNRRDGRQTEPKICKWKDCKARVLVHIKDQYCGVHYQRWQRLLKRKPQCEYTGGKKWGYKDYRTYKKLKKKSCELCGARKKLIQHHRDGNTRNPRSSNLITVCHTCHVKKLHKYKKTSKFLRLYGKSCKDLAKENGIKESTLYARLKKEKYKKSIDKTNKI